MFSVSDNVCHILGKLDAISKNRRKVQRILDVGCGFGKWGFLCRGWLDSIQNGAHKAKWTHTINAVEIFEPYITPVHRYIYNKIIIDDFRNLFKTAGDRYTIILMGDCLEHIPMDEGKEVIKRFVHHCDHLIISVPGYRDSQTAKFGNEAERHQAWWSEHDFLDVDPNCEVKRIGKLLTAHFK